MPQSSEDFAYSEYLRLAGLTPAELLIASLNANRMARKDWRIPEIPPQVVVLSCINPSHRLSLLFGEQPMLIDHLRKPLGLLSPVTMESIKLAVAAHQVKVVIWLPSLSSGQYHPVQMSNLVATEDTMIDHYHLQPEHWQGLHDDAEIDSLLQSGELLTAKLRLDPKNNRLSIDRIRLGQDRERGQEALPDFLHIGKQTERTEKEITDCTPEEILGLLLWKNYSRAVANLLDKLLPLGCFFTCMDPRICYFGPNSIFQNFPLLIHNMRIPGASFPAVCRDAAIYCVERDNLKILAWISHDSTCAMAQLYHQGEANHIPQLRNHFGKREEHWLEITSHPSIRSKIEKGELIVVRLDLDLMNGALTLCDFQYQGPDRDLLAAWVSDSKQSDHAHLTPHSCQC